MIIPEIMKKMVDYSVGNLHDINHFIKVHTYAKLIGELEGLDRNTLETLELAAIVHDIACPLCRMKYGSAPGKKQEEEGEILTRDFFQGTGVSKDKVERIAYLVGHHHTVTNVDGDDYRILLEADYLVNADESQYTKENILNAWEKIFKTDSGKALLKSMYMRNDKGTDYLVKPVPEYISQFASRELISRYLNKTIDPATDPKWTSFGFEKLEEYIFWMERLCGLICTKMVLNTYSSEVEEKSIAELTEEGLSLGGYKIYDEEGNYIDMGWFYQPLIELARRYGMDGKIHGTLTVEDICKLVKDNAYAIVSVNPRIIRGDVKEGEKKGGHLVLVVGFRQNENGCEGLYIHNPSGRTLETQERAFIPMDRFMEAFAGRGFSLFYRK